MPAELHYTNDVPYLTYWGERVGTPVTSADALAQQYAKARPWILSLQKRLVEEYGWRSVTPTDPRMLFRVQCPSPRSSNGIRRTPDMFLELPQHASTFFSPNRQLDWQIIFHGSLFPAMRHTCDPLADILHLLQCIFTGMLVLVLEEDVPGDGKVATSRALPPAEWVATNRERLTAVLGESAYRRLYQAANNPRIAFSLGRPPQPIPARAPQ